MTKDPYCFEFLTLHEKVQEREIEQGLLANLRDLLIELGMGFAFVGSQYPLKVGNREFFVDMLFYHLVLRCYVVVELKAGAFEPEYAGKLNFYLSAVDELLRHPTDQPTIGILLCKEKQELMVKYALRDLNKPIGVANWEAQQELDSLLEEPIAGMQGCLPDPEELQAGLFEDE